MQLAQVDPHEKADDLDYQVKDIGKLFFVQRLNVGRNREIGELI